MKPSEELRRDAMDKIEGAANAMMHDERLGLLRRPAVRRTIAVLAVLSALGCGWSFGAEGPYALINFVAVLGATFLLQRINRGFMDLPDAFVDDRIRQRRGETFWLAYLGLAGALAIAVPLMLVFRGMFDPFAGAMALFALALVLPGVVFAWRETEL